MSTTATLSERVATRVSSLLAGRGHDRRRFLSRAALVGTALAVNPFGFLLRPQSAYASVCGPANECSQGWTAFCCTINGGANTCPPGSYVAGWWKITSSSFCRGGARYIVDCNRLPEAHCSCRCADGACDRRRVCCNNFRYGQCNQQIRGTTPVVCRVVICTPPWEWDASCTTTVRTDNRTANHSSTCIPGPNPTEIDLVYLDLGLTGSVLGSPAGPEEDGPRGGRWRPFEHGAITAVAAYGVQVLTGPIGERYAELRGPHHDLGYAVSGTAEVGDGRGTVAEFETGTIWWTETTGATAVTDPIRHRYVSVEGGPLGWLGYPTSGVEDAPGGRSRVTFEAGWMLVHDPSTGEVRLLPDDAELSDTPGEWPPSAEVVRWAGEDRIGTAAEVARRAFPDGADVALLARADDHTDALVGGAAAGILGGPVLLVRTDGLPPATADVLATLDPSRVLVLGGESAVGGDVVAAVADLLPEAEVERLAGEDRFATAAAISRATIDSSSLERVFVASARDFPDALAAAPAAARDGAPILLVEPGFVPDPTAEELARLAPRQVVVLGGESVVEPAVAEQLSDAADAEVVRWAGPSRYDTAAEVVRRTHDRADVVVVATGAAFPDGLAAGPAAVAEDAPLVLSDGRVVPRVIRELVADLGPSRIILVGGEGVLSRSVAEQLAALGRDARERAGAAATS